METPAPTPPARKGFFRRLFSWRTLVKLLFLLLALITLGALFFAEEHWRGARAWKSYKREMEAKRVSFDVASLIPAKVPDEENFGMTPLFAPIFTLPPGDPSLPMVWVTNSQDGEYFAAANRGTNILLPLFSLNINRRPRLAGWNIAMAGDLSAWAVAIQNSNSNSPPSEIPDPVQAASIILESLKPFEPTLAELQSATTRPYSQFNLPYDEVDKLQVQSVMGENITLVTWLMRVLTLHCEAEMVAGRTDLALEDINVMFRMDDGLKDEPIMFCQMTRLACIARMLESVGEGLAERRWSDAQLQVLQEWLQKTDLLASAVLAINGERDLYFNPIDLGPVLPRGWACLEQINVNRAIQETVLPRIDLAAREINPTVNRSLELLFHESHSETGFKAVLHHNLMATLELPIFSMIPQRTAMAQSEVDMAMLACALERYRLAQGQYPENLNALIPRFVAVLPHDIINGQPLKYRRLENGRFILYSVGWNEKDDGGMVVAVKSDLSRQDPLQGDWVWQYPEKP